MITKDRTQCSFIAHDATLYSKDRFFTLSFLLPSAFDMLMQIGVGMENRQCRERDSRSQSRLSSLDFKRPASINYSEESQTH
jgi:hypothetical protein